ncbi:CLUMA_CG018172, isoform A [Clunio marinus]|uniref:CLUMA_CG018172, isoform A n=1 Tax=Clunio marinus TaxID=568069 RepID=A0A1J1IXG0_9DIPT|nr:CLUMA_CG018172, isoform A [Clunio marinus]
MSICRMCGDEKPKEDLVISLNDVIAPNQDLLFVDIVEFYTRIEFDKNKALPDLVCNVCKTTIGAFSMFTLKVEEAQMLFKEQSCTKNYRSPDKMDEKPFLKDKSPEAIKSAGCDEKDFDVSDDSFKDCEGDSGSELKESNSVEDDCEDSGLKSKRIRKQKVFFDPSITFETTKEPKIKKRRMSMFHERPEPEKESPIPFKRVRSLSFYSEVPLKNTSKCSISESIKKVEEIFRNIPKSKLQPFENIMIDKSKLLADNEVPRLWLTRFKHFQSWDNFLYKCHEHCDEKIRGLHKFINHYILHNVSMAKYSVSCHLCEHRTFAGPKGFNSYVNHMTRHNECLKFCCIVCSKVFFDVPSLAKHYHVQHPGDYPRNIGIYKCLDCGLCCQSIGHLKSHIKYSHKY